MRIGILSLALVCFGTVAQADVRSLTEINAERSANGRSVLTYDRRLEKAAQMHASDMANRGFFSHTGSDGSDVRHRLKRAGYKYCVAAENIAWGQKSRAGVMNGWMNSKGHRKNILNHKVKSVGLAEASGGHWVMVLAAPC